jgi:hypothetical protein
MMSVLLANAGTPLIWAAAFHLVVGNALIGLLEGWLLIRLYGLRATRTVPIVIVGNYFSMFIGQWSVAWVASWSEHVTILNVQGFLFLTALAFFVATVVLELPFVLAALWKNDRWIRRSVNGSLVAQTASYGVLFAYYWNVSAVSMLTQANIQRDIGFAAEPSHSIFFVGSADRHLYEVALDGSEPRRVGELGRATEFARLFLRQSRDGEALDLCLADRDANVQTLVVRVAVDLPTESSSPHGNEQDSWWEFGAALDLRPSDELATEVETGFWPVEGIVVRQGSAGVPLRLALETPFVAWYARCATALPGNQVIFQLNDQIVLFDIESRKLGLVARGYGPLVIPAANRCDSTKAARRKSIPPRQDFRDPRRRVAESDCRSFSIAS